MGFFNHHSEESERAYNTFYNDQPHHEAKFSHEAVSGAAAFFAMHEYEKHQEQSGQPVNHKFIKEIVAAAAAAEADKLIETKGLDWVDREKAQRHARQQAEQMVDQKYGGGGGYGMQQGGYGNGPQGGYGGGMQQQGGYGGGMPQQGGYGGGMQQGGYGGPQGGFGGPQQGGFGGPQGGYGGPQQGGYGGQQGGYGGQGGYGNGY